MYSWFGGFRLFRRRTGCGLTRRGRARRRGILLEGGGRPAAGAPSECRVPGGSGANSATSPAPPGGATSAILGPEPAAGSVSGALSPWSWLAGPGSVSPGPEVVPVAVGGLFHQGSPGGLAGRSAATADHEYMAPEAATRHDPSTVMSAGMFALPCVRIRHTPCAVGRRHTECAAYIVFRRTRWRPRSVRQRGRKNCRSTPALRPAR